MEKPGALKLEVGKLAETKSFDVGFRGAWFRCKIKDIQLKKNEFLPEYYDFDPAELVWEKIYQVPPCSRKTKNVKKHLMLRPQYPMRYKKSEMPPVDSISQVCVVYDGNWKVGDLVDWFADGVYWSVRIVKVLSKEKFKVELPMPPLGEGKPGEEGIHEACGNDFRPTLKWSETDGWTLPSVEGRPSCDAQLVFPTKQGMDWEPEPAAAASSTRISAGGDEDSEQNEGSVKMNCDLGINLEPEPAAAGSTTRGSTEGDRDRDQNEKSAKMVSDFGMDLEPAAAGSTTHNAGDRDIEQNEISMKMDCDLMGSSESTSSLQKKVAADEVEKTELNIMHEDTLEAAVLDLEELVTKVNWLQRLLTSNSNDATPSSWKFLK